MTWFFSSVAATAAITAYSQNEAAVGAAEQANRQSEGENKAIVEANLRNSARSAYRAGLMNLQLGQTKRENAQAGFDRSVQAKQVLGAITANQAAAGTVGSSFEAVAQEVEMRLGEAEAAQRDNFELAMIDFNNDLDALTMNTEDNMQQARKYEYHGPSAKEIWLGAAVQTAGSYASSYASKRMSLGTSSAVTPTATPSVGGITGQGSSPGLRMSNSSGPGLRL